MKKSMSIVLVCLVLLATPAFAQQRIISGKVTSEQGTPLAGVLVAIKGTIARTATNNEGNYSIRAEGGKGLQYSLIGSGLVERIVAAEDVINVQLRRVALDLDAVVVTALGQTATQRSLGYAQQSVTAANIVQSQRENFVNALQGRVAGVDVTSTSGVPGASASITIRGISSISGSNQPLIIVDGLPMDNRTLSTTLLASDFNSNTALSNRGVDFTNRAADLNPDDIETLTVLKGPEAAALYGIDAANGAIVITTKRGRAGGGFQYSNSFRLESTRAKPELQRIWGPSGVLVSPFAATNSFAYFGAPYPAGTRRRLLAGILSASTEVDDPYFNVAKNQINSKNNRIIANVGITLTPVSWANLKTNIGTDAYTNSNLLLRNPESVVGAAYNGLLDLADLIQKNTNVQTLLNFNSHQLTNSLSVTGLVGNSISDYKATTDAATGRDFLDPNFVSINNTNLRTSKTTIEQRRLIGAFGQASIDFRNYLYLNVTGRNDWTSTIPKGRNSFFYPSFSSSFIFSDAFPGIQRFMTGKLRAAVASVGKDARPYAYRPALQYKTTAYGGYGYNFTGPNLALKPEFARSREFGAELSFLNDRLGLDATVYRKQTLDQIVNDIRGSYGTGFILFNLNGASTRNKGVEITLRGTPIQSSGFSWDFQANYARERGIVVSLPHALPESYVSDTWLYGNVRNGTQPGLSTMSLTGLFYLRNKQGELLIDPTSGPPIRSANFISR